jgi:predicted pyridoxine 5'-phosphate oxidase superfamily flavin-nucleotide-binding protein
VAALDDRAKAIVDRPNLAFVATVMRDGSPQVTPVWSDPRIAIAVVDRDDDYTRVLIRGRVVEMIEGDEADRQIDRLSKKYTGRDEYQGHKLNESRVKVVVEPVSVR